MVNLNNLMYKLWVYVKNVGMYVFLAYLVDLISYAQGKDWSQHHAQQITVQWVSKHIPSTLLGEKYEL